MSRPHKTGAEPSSTRSGGTTTKKKRRRRRPAANPAEQTWLVGARGRQNLLLGSVLGSAALIAVFEVTAERADMGAALAAAMVVVVLFVIGAAELVHTLRRPSAPPRALPFAEGFPEHPEIERLLEAFRAGNFAYVRREATVLAERSKNERVRQAALDLRRRIEPDPTALYLLGIGVALLVLLYGYYLSHAP